MDWSAVVGAAIAGVISLLGVLAANRKTTAVYMYRVDQIEKAIKKLEDKQDRHNNMIERVIRLEGRMTEAEHDIKDLKGGK